MNEPLDRAATDEATDVSLEDLGHPPGTLAIVILYALLFALGWIARWCRSPVAACGIGSGCGRWRR